MARALIAVGIALVLAMGGLGLAVYLTRDEDYITVDELLSERITRAVQLAEEENGGRVDLAEQAPFAWQRVLLVARATPTDEISRAIGYRWNGRTATEGFEQFLFMQHGRVVRFADYRGKGRFEGFPRPIARMSRDTAVMQVRDLVVRPGGR